MIRAFLALSVLALGVNSFAATSTASAEMPTTNATAPAAVTSKLTYKDAKASCLAENAALKGKDLRTCVKGKQTAAKDAGAVTK